MPKSLNSVQLIGNLTRDPELRTTNTGRPVCDISLATNRSWKTDSGEQKENTEFHRIVVWGKLAETCGQYLRKGQKAYFAGRLASRHWTGQDGVEKYTTEIIAEDMIMLSNGKSTGDYPAAQATVDTPDRPDDAASTKTPDADNNAADAAVDPDEIPF